MLSIQASIRSRALALGFHAVGFAPAEPSSTGDHFLRWLDAGHHGEMGYLARDPQKRIDPRLYWTDVRSLIVLSTSYAPPLPDPQPSPSLGRMARYSRDVDYHDVLRERLLVLGQHVLSLLPGAQFKPVVDSSAFMERPHAIRGGLGWAAKNTMLLNRSLGSYTLLSALLIDRELPTDPPATAHCGSCTRCIDACPTDALLGPGELDARKCISYLTIELKGAIPEALRPQLDGWLFGCDVCQEVCPWVKKAGAPATPGSIVPAPALAALPLTEVLEETDASFAARWKGRPQKRSKRHGLARNAAVLLGNSPDSDTAVPSLARALLEDPHPLVREHAAWGLGRHGTGKARAALEAARSGEESSAVLEAVGKALEGRFSSPSSPPPPDVATPPADQCSGTRQSACPDNEP